jgi:CCR4-NOT transcription complex subunit 6
MMERPLERPLVLHPNSLRLSTSEGVFCGVTLEPYVIVKRDNTPIALEDVPEEGSADGVFQLRPRWYRCTLPRPGSVCSVHPDREAGLQCTVCLRQKVAQHLSYHCSVECLKSHWHLHKEYHQFQSNGEQPGPSWGQPWGWSWRGAFFEPLRAPLPSDCTAGDAYANFKTGSGVEEWIEVGSSGGTVFARGRWKQLGWPSQRARMTTLLSDLHATESQVARTRTYTPTFDDVGYVLRFQCHMVDRHHPSYVDPSKIQVVDTSRVRPSPNPPARSMVQLMPAPSMGYTGRFSLLSYNLLADLYAKVCAHAIVERREGQMDRGKGRMELSG